MPDRPPSPVAVPEAEREAADQLSRVHGANGLQAAILALLLPAGSRRAARAWEIEVEGTPEAGALREHVGQLSEPARLPWFEALVSRMRGQPLAARQDLLEATRRLMGARGVVRPIDRLHWLSMRQRLSGAAGAGPRVAAAADLSQLPQVEVEAIAAYSAFLSRLVPLDSSAAGADPLPGRAWYDTVMAPWQARATVPACRAPDTDGLVYALQNLQALAWMQRPIVIRSWVTAALLHSRPQRLSSSAADALRLSCALLDSPLPPELARHYGATSQELAR